MARIGSRGVGRGMEDGERGERAGEGAGGMDERARLGRWHRVRAAGVILRAAAERAGEGYGWDDLAEDAVAVARAAGTASTSVRRMREALTGGGRWEASGPPLWALVQARRAARWIHLRGRRPSERAECRAGALLRRDLDPPPPPPSR